STHSILLHLSFISVLIFPITSPSYCLCHFLFFFQCYGVHRHLHSFPTRRSSDLQRLRPHGRRHRRHRRRARRLRERLHPQQPRRSEEHTSELQSRFDLVCRLLLEKKKKYTCNFLTFYLGEYMMTKLPILV